MMKIIVRLLSVIGLVLAVSSADAQTVKWRLGNPWPAKHPATADLISLIADIKARSSGRLDIEMIYLDAIGFKQADNLRVLKQRVVNAVLFVPYYVGRDAPRLSNVVPVGGLLDADDNLKIVEMQRAYAQKILRSDWNAVMPIPFFNRGGRDLLLISREPVNTLEGLKGRKLRHFDRLSIQAMKNLDISAQTIPQAELYIALQTGVVDSAIHGLTNTKAQSLQEVTCCFSEFSPFPGQGAPYGVAIRADIWEKLPTELQKAVVDAGDASWKAGLAEWKTDAESKEAKKFLREKGMRELPPLSSADRRQLQKAVLAVWREQSEKLGPDALELYNNVTAALGN